ncbi:MAG: helix-turn-helix domain-containing protein [Clostridia bacterium]|nr:helix-turn-helix domain-containing protein [Clostridia bacterium]
MLSTKLRALRKEKGLSLEQVAEAIGTSRQTVHRYETGVITNIPHDKIEALARALGATPASLMGWEEDSKIATLNNITTGRITAVSAKKLPVLGNVACGEPIFATEESDCYVSAGVDIGADFCLTARGDSMINARIFDGDLLFVKQQPSVDDGEIAVVLIDDEATVKRVYFDRENAILTLMPENPTYKPMRYMGSQLDRIRILGKVVSGQYKI